MNIFIVSRGYPTPKDPQWGCFELDQARALKELGHQVVVISVDGRFRLYWRKIGITKFVNEGIGFINIFLCPIKLFALLSPKYIVKIKVKQLLYIYKKAVDIYGIPDIVYAHYMFNIAHSTFLKEKYNIPVVGMEHWSQLNKARLNKLERYMGELAYGRTNEIIAVSESLRLRIKEHFGRDSLVIHNMVGKEFFMNPVREKTERKSITFISVGSLLPVKGYDILIKAMNRISNDILSWELILVGEGPERGHLQNMVHKYGLSNHIKLLGRRNKIEIIRLLDNSDVYISSSRSENFSVSVIEGLSRGLPVVATLCGGIRECIDDRNGLLVPVEDEESLAEAIHRMAETIGNYSRLEISKTCESRFAPQVIAKQLTCVFEEAIESNNKHQ